MVPRTAGPLKNNQGITIPDTLLKFLLVGKDLGAEGPVIGLQKDTDYFYVWKKTGWGKYEGPYIEGHLQNKEGVSVPVNSLKFVVVTDLLNEGHDQIVGLQAGTNWMYVWSLKDANGKYYHRPVVDGELRNRTNARVPVDSLKYVFSGDFDGCGSDEIRGLQENTSWNYFWTLPVIDWKFTLKYDGPLHNRDGIDVPVNSLSYIVKSRDDLNGSNNAGPDILVAIQKDWYYVWGFDAKPIWDSDLQPSKYTGKKLIFSLEQIWQNGLLNTVSADRIWNTIDKIVDDLNAFKQQYDVYALVNPVIKDKTKLIQFLDYLKTKNVKFFLDIYSSDNEAASRVAATHVQVADPYRVLSLRPRNELAPTDPMELSLEYYVDKYPNHFAGIRLFEILALNYLYTYCVHEREDARLGNCRDFELLKKSGGELFVPKYIESYLNFVKNKNLMLFWSDNHWYNPWEIYRDNSRYEMDNFPYLRFELSTMIERVKSEVKRLAKLYPNIIILGYSNNEGVKNWGRVQIPYHYRLKNWHYFLKTITDLRNIALSNQSWLSDNDPILFDETTPIEDLILWTFDAFTKGAEIVQFEPFWYFWSWPRGDLFNPIDPAKLDWNSVGNSTSNLKTLAEFLGIELKK